MNRTPVEMTSEQTAAFVDESRRIMGLHLQREHTPWYRLRARRAFSKQIHQDVRQLVLDLGEAGGRATQP